MFYVEEAQETLKHIRKIGISTLAEKWINSNARPEIVVLEKETNSKVSLSIKENILGLIKSTDNLSIQTKSPINFSAISKSYESMNFNTAPKSILAYFTILTFRLYRYYLSIFST